ncbi:hypothetical protein KRR39_18435 [Nocardioides panacis]|uniref:CBU-0592-like domain-containing protein n=1 Tax=Nocardioides panacis TaxID=2849501 RepID=A0A975SX18_9ACTN|nr:hypothetical protein [Nocardioides panacis]QWZ07411.1 hypothetical protein KRR39_18435 [Nocardioides panacis]
MFYEREVLVTTLIDVIGWAGAGTLVLAYALAAGGTLSVRTRTSAAMNVLGGLGLLINSAANDAWPSVGLNLVWLGIGMTGLIRYWRYAFVPAEATSSDQREG